MPMQPGADIDIQNVEAEITDASREVRERVQRGGGPSRQQLARQMREVMAREAWRQARLSAD